MGAACTALPPQRGSHAGYAKELPAEGTPQTNAVCSIIQKNGAEPADVVLKKLG